MALTLALIALGIAFIATVIVGLMDLHRLQTRNRAKEASGVNGK